MIQESVYKFAKRNVEQFAKAGPDDLDMASTLIDMELKTRTSTKGSEEYITAGYVSIAISAAIIHRYEEQNNLHNDSPTTVDLVQCTK